MLLSANGETYEEKRNWTKRYGKLPNGEYRFIQWTSSEPNQKYYWAEFTIDDNTPDEEPKEPQPSRISENMSVAIKEETLTPNGATVIITDKSERETRKVHKQYVLAKQERR